MWTKQHSRPSPNGDCPCWNNPISTRRVKVSQGLDSGPQNTWIKKVLRPCPVPPYGALVCCGIVLVPIWYLYYINEYKWCKCLGQWYWMIGVEASAFDIQEMSLRVQVCSLEIPWWKRAPPVFQATEGPCQSGTCFKFFTDTMRSNDSLNAQQPDMQNCSLRKTSRKSYAKSVNWIK